MRATDAKLRERRMNMAGMTGTIRLRRVNHLTYCVKDKERATRFWVDVLGVKEIPSMVDSDHIVWLQLPSGTMVHLIEHEDAPSEPSHHGAFEVEDIDEAQEYMRERGVETTDITQRHDGQRVFFIEDTEGNRIEICTKSGFGVLV